MHNYSLKKKSSFFYSGVSEHVDALSTFSLTWKCFTDIIWTNGLTGPTEKNLYCWAVLPWQSQLSHTDQPDRKLNYFTRFYIHTHTNYTHTCTYINTLLTRSHSFSPIQSCANLWKNKSTPLDSLCDVCTFCARVCGVKWNNSILLWMCVSLLSGQRPHKVHI